MAWTWFPIKTVAETLQNGVPDETVALNLDGIGDETVRFIQGVTVGLIFRNFLLFPNMNGQNPFTKNDKIGAMIFEDQYWIGINDEA
tara:strand:- start:1334 stop:1594 length:261 start_codon:yes stop_codon:yes gene_type:complete